ncbi:MAG: hypothetical protein H6R10_447 [Rhodocyclaceae bacterium]|nr:hypothetical protein [Rhodocyclaceae bacterium]
MIPAYDSWLRHQDRKFAVACSVLGAAAMGLGGTAQAQAQTDAGQPATAVTTPGPIPAPAGRAGTGPAAQPTIPPLGQETTVPPRHGLSIVPRITVAETLTDNVAPSSGVKRSDQITEIAPGIRIDSDGARLKAHLDYQLRQLFYAQESGRQNTQNHLNAFGTLEAVDKWLYVDASGVVAQQEISPFRLQSASNTTINPNRVETSSFRVSPYARGRLSGTADYELRYDRSATRSSSAFAADVDTDEWRGILKSTTPLSVMDWRLDASHRNTDYSGGGRSNVDDHWRAQLGYRLDPEFRVSASAGQEDNNYGSATKESHGLYGYGFDWLPSDRTRVSAFRETRFFGHGHNVSVDHRTPLTALRFTDVQDVAVLPSRFTAVGLGSIHDLLFTQLTSSIADPVERSRYVDSLLQQLGIAPNAVVTRGFLTSRVSVQRRQELAYSLQGRRDVLTLSAARTEHKAVGPDAGANDIFTVSGNIRQRGVAANFAHRLTPLSSLGLVVSQQHSSGSTSADLGNRLRSFHVSFSTRLGPQTTASLGARRVLFDSRTAPSYMESALLASLTAFF